MTEPVHCPECGALWPEGRTCEDDFHQMLFWETEYPAYFAAVHHLLVLCFSMQHPRRYTAEGLDAAKLVLIEFVANGATPQEMRRRNAAHFASDRRTTVMTARPDNQGAYAHPVRWTMTAADVARADVHSYVENTRRWAQAAYDDLVASGNLTRPPDDE